MGRVVLGASGTACLSALGVSVESQVLLLPGGITALPGLPRPQVCATVTSVTPSQRPTLPNHPYWGEEVQGG